MNATERYNEITRIRAAATNLTDAIEELQAVKKEWDYLDLGNAIVVGDFRDRHEGLTVTDLANVVGTTLGAIDTLLAAGHGTNLYTAKLR
jgi:hypothetical protein